jgi:hypothetical protein
LGTIASPYLLCTAQQVAAISQNASDLLSSFQLEADVDFTGTAFSGIGSSVNPFKGRFLGKNFKIKNVNINISSGNSVGFFNATETAQIRDLNLQNFSIVAPTSNEVGAAIGDCQSSQVINFNLSNASIQAFGEVGGIMGVSYYCDVYGAEMSGTLAITDEILGGVVGGVEKGFFFNVQSQLNLNAPVADGVGGIFGGDYWATPIFQNIQMEGDIVGDEYVGGFNGYNYEGASIYRSSFKGTVTGRSAVGGMSGVNWDSPYAVYSSFVEATINGNNSIGGFSGLHEYRTNYYDSYVKATLNGTGVGQYGFGGFFGSVEYYGNVIRSYADVTINSSSSSVGGAVGVINYWSGAYDIRDTFVVANVSGNNALSHISLFQGVNNDVAMNALNSYYWSGGNCVNGGGGGCNTNKGTAEANLSAFYSSSHPSMSAWNFSNVWTENTSALPTLNWNHYHTPDVTYSCAPGALVNNNYVCNVSFVDADVNEKQMIVFEEDHTCSWMYLNDMGFRGKPTAQQQGPCIASFRVTDGSLRSAIKTFSVNVYNVTITPDISSQGFYDYLFQSVAAGEKQMSFTITNNDSLAITSLSVTGLPANGFVFKGGGAYPGSTGSCGTTLAAGASCTVDISFDPTTTGRVYNSIQLNFNIGTTSGTANYELSGYGT